jgi:hypothetical protein
LALTYSGTALPVVNGGTGVTASSGANSVMLRDANQNTIVNSLTEGFINVAAAGTTTTLTASSAPNYCVTGSGGQTYQLPDATTLTAGTNYFFNNNQTSGTIVVKNNSSTTIATIQSGGYVEVLLLANTPAAGLWDVHNYAPANVSWSTNTLDYAGSITSAIWNGTTVAINRGGTGQTTQAAAITALTGTQTAGRYLRSDGTNAALAAIVAADVPTLNQNTTGTSANVTGTVAIANGGSGQTTAQLAINAFAGAVTSGSYLRGNGTNVVMNTIQAADVPTLNQNTTGTSANVTGIVAVANGGTGNTGTTANLTVDGTDAVGFRNIPQNAQTGSYTMVLADSGKHIYHASGAGAATYTIPAASSVAYPIGTAITFINLSTTAISIAITTDTMYLSSAGTTGTRTLAQYGSATAIKVSGLSSSGIWVISGSALT